MQYIQIDGTFTYAQNIKELKIGDIIKLRINPSNRINKDAIGAYTLSGVKIGYVPFKSNQIDIKAKYRVSKINLTQDHPLLLIAREFEQSNFILTEPDFIKESKYKGIIINRTDSDLKDFKRYLEVSKILVQDVGIEYQDENFINLIIKTDDSINRFYTVTKKYYEENVFKYDEFYKFKLIPKCIYQPFQIHRLESYIEKKYKPIDKLVKSKKFKLENIFDDFNEDLPNYGFETITDPNLKVINKNKINEINLIKLIIRYNINPYSYINPNYDAINLDLLKDMFNDLKIGGLCYNHNLKKYCHIDLHDDTNIIEISTDTSVNSKIFVELLIKSMISDKQIINIYNPIKGIIFRYEINEVIKDKLLNLFK
jgi:hypothetical protein